MKRLFLLPLFFLSACSPDSAHYVAVVSQSKQKHKIISLQKKLDTAEKEQRSKEQDVHVLKEELRGAELDLIRSAVETCEFKLATNQQDDLEAGLFLNEREQLHRMIHSGSSSTSSEAQIVLDQILRMITHFSERQSLD
jgi:hypothetical protein